MVQIFIYLPDWANRMAGRRIQTKNSCGNGTNSPARQKSWYNL